MKFRGKDALRLVNRVSPGRGEMRVVRHFMAVCAKTMAQ